MGWKTTCSAVSSNIYGALLVRIKIYLPILDTAGTMIETKATFDALMSRPSYQTEPPSEPARLAAYNRQKDRCARRERAIEGKEYYVQRQKARATPFMDVE
jgi:hypothetical protein